MAVRVYVALAAYGDDPNAEGTQLLGVFSEETHATDVAQAAYPRTGEVEAYTLDEPPEWVSDGEFAARPGDEAAT